MLDFLPYLLAMLAPLTRRVRMLERRAKWALRNGTLENVEEGAEDGKESA